MSESDKHIEEKMDTEINDFSDAIETRRKKMSDAEQKRIGTWQDLKRKKKEEKKGKEKAAKSGRKRINATIKPLSNERKDVVEDEMYQALNIDRNKHLQDAYEFLQIIYGLLMVKQSSKKESEDLIKYLGFNQKNLEQLLRAIIGTLNRGDQFRTVTNLKELFESKDSLNILLYDKVFKRPHNVIQILDQIYALLKPLKDQIQSIDSDKRDSIIETIAQVVQDGYLEWSSQMSAAATNGITDAAKDDEKIIFDENYIQGLIDAFPPKGTEAGRTTAKATAGERIVPPTHQSHEERAKALDLEAIHSVLDQTEAMNTMLILHSLFIAEGDERKKVQDDYFNGKDAVHMTKELNKKTQSKFGSRLLSVSHKKGMDILAIIANFFCIIDQEAIVKQVEHIHWILTALYPNLAPKEDKNEGDNTREPEPKPDTPEGTTFSEQPDSKISFVGLNKSYVIPIGKHVEIAYAMPNSTIQIADDAKASIRSVGRGVTIELQGEHSYVEIRETKKECEQEPITIKTPDGMDINTHMKLGRYANPSHFIT